MTTFGWVNAFRSISPLVVEVQRSSRRRTLSSVVVLPVQQQQQHNRCVPLHPTTVSVLGGIRTNSISSWFGLGSTTGTTATQERMVTDADVDTSSSPEQQQQQPQQRPQKSIEEMTGREMKIELEGDYGIDTKSFFEKNEYRIALEKARSIGIPSKTSKQSSSSSSSSTTTTTTTTSSSTKDALSRDEQIRLEMIQCQSMAARDMKQELEQVYGISTRSLFEKSEFIRALATARVDRNNNPTTTSANNNNNNNSRSNSGGASSSSSSSSSSSNTNTNTEGYAEYTDVEVLTDDSSGPRQKGQDAQRSSPQSSQVQPPMDPFAGMGGMGGMGGGMGGMGGAMGGFANLFNTMGGVGNASPFGSGGGNPFGNVGSNDNMMGKLQQMMSNPKVMSIIQKAQSNPRMMSKVQECMSNPTAMLKYQNDPEVAELIRELQPYLK